ncbi:uncharacterized peroxidase-related enzyme [Micromonospora inositola]|uniref:Uncharacterized peroxidase-related enzyme n=1 Tax=Micromonospora inositola TaxID=47865 RepID=A0A1C5JU18_9ACTN|nr:carboxymuconolactone decarboxylase family protein [Micromonospora inositola]SCG73811.1 uncharacterized peroxidase-related enzyme [Micromonospora inositola]
MGGSALSAAARTVGGPNRDGDAIAHIDLGLDEARHPGIQGLLRFRPETAGPLNALAETLLRAPHPTLTPGERELIAAYVSGLNDCGFCRASHSATAAAQLPAGMSLVEQVRADVAAAPVGEKLRALLRIAAAVQRGGREVTGELVDAARAAGATDLELHDTVLIAAAFCMYNRYVDGLAAFTPEDPRAYEMGARHLVAHGYAAG